MYRIAVNYKMFKKILNPQLNILKLPEQLRIPLVKFRCRNHKLPIELGIYRKIERNKRLCKYCLELGDEFHYLFQCKIFEHERALYLKNYYRKNPSSLKFDQLMNTSGKSLINLSIFVRIIIKKVDEAFLYS